MVKKRLSCVKGIPVTETKGCVESSNTETLSNETNETLRVQITLSNT